jgi:hypothetical protein
MNTKLDPNVWGPHYWFFLHSIAYSYPESPNAVTKRKYYDLIQNFPLFIPVSDMGDKFSRLLDKYPVSPYLCSRDSFVRWVHFIHNKVNVSIGHPEITYMESVDKYNAQYKSVPAIFLEKVNTRRYYIFMALILVCLFLIFYFYE